MKKLLAILLVLALSLGMLPMALADEPTVLTIGSIITKRDLDKNVLIQRIAEKPLYSPGARFFAMSAASMGMVPLPQNGSQKSSLPR